MNLRRVHLHDRHSLIAEANTNGGLTDPQMRQLVGDHQKRLARPTSATSSEAAVAGNPRYVTPSVARHSARSSVRSDGSSDLPNTPNRNVRSRPVMPDNVVRCNTFETIASSSPLSSWSAVRRARPV